MRKAVIGILLVLCVAMAAAFGAAIWAWCELRSALPQTSGNLTLTGISGQVDIYRDEYGIPHIYAQNQRDLMFAVGFVSAQDRLWQMDVTRRAATGRLAEIFGETALKADLLVRTLDFEQIAKREVAILPPPLAVELEAYSNGVNAYIEQQAALPPEFGVLDYRPEPWRPFESLAISRLLAWQLSKNFESEIVIWKLVEKLGAERAAELGPTYPSSGPFILSGEAVGSPGRSLSTLEDGSKALDEIVGTSGGSNSWVIGGSRTVNDAPILANDPHLSGTKMPSIWYYVHLVGGKYDVIGSLVPGTPLPILGHNRRIGWGVTNMNADVQDLYIERINREDPHQYEYDGRWVDMDSRWERIYFRTRKGERSFIEKQIKLTIHGPLVNELAPGVTDAISLRWTGLDPSRDYQALAGISVARNWKEFCRALSNFSVAPQNFIYADGDGNIGYYGAGRIPIRSGGDGVMPQQGWLGENTWSGEIPFEEMPHELNPPDDYIVTANNRVAGDDYEHFLSAEWAPAYRSGRIAELLESTQKHDAKSVASMQSDTRSLLAELLLEIVMPTIDGLTGPEARQAAAYLKQWGFDNTKESVAATIYHEFLLKFAFNTFADDLGNELAREYLNQYYLWIERFVGFVQEDSHWFDDRRTDAVENRDDMVIRSFEEAVASLRSRLGGDMSDWRWGKTHRVEFRHPLDRIRIFRMLFNRGPFPFPGDGESVNRGTFAFSDPYRVTMAASLRHIMDFSDVGVTLGIHTTGQSGNPASRHYDDFVERWRNGSYVSLMMNEQDFAGKVEGHLKLLPAIAASAP